MTKEREICGVKVIVSGETYNEYKETLEEQLKEKDKEIERLNNIINELESYIKHYDKIEGYYEYVECGYDEYNSDEDVKEQILDYIKELKEGK